MARKDWNYSGDMNLEHGGFFWKVTPGDDFAEAVEVIPHSDVGGPDCMWWVHKGSIYLPEDMDKRRSALACCGYSLTDTGDVEDGTGTVYSLDTLDGMTLLVDAFNAYHGIERDHVDTVVQIGKLTDYDPDPVAEPDVILRGNAKLRNYVRRAFL